MATVIGGTGRISVSLRDDWEEGSMKELFYLFVLFSKFSFYMLSFSLTNFAVVLLLFICAIK